MQKNKYWEIDNGDVKETHTFRFRSEQDIDNTYPDIEFMVKRHKSKIDASEILEVSATVNNIPCGVKCSKIDKLENILVEFRNYGVVLKTFHFKLLNQIIIENFYKLLPLDIDTGVGGEENMSNIEDSLKEVMLEIIDYIDTNIVRCSKTIMGQDVLFIPILEFDKIISTKKLSLKRTEIKKLIYENFNTIVNVGSYDYVIKEDGRPVKTICFKREIYDKICIANGESQLYSGVI